jgi:hypothetical protein
VPPFQRCFSTLLAPRDDSSVAIISTHSAQKEKKKRALNRPERDTEPLFPLSPRARQKKGRRKRSSLFFFSFFFPTSAATHRGALFLFSQR